MKASSEQGQAARTAQGGKLRILCLHGYHGSAETLRDQMRGLAAGVESLVEFVYVDAPSLAAGDYGWWHARRDESGRDDDDSGVGRGRMRYEGWDATRAAIVSIFAKQGPFDGVFGFSQGAALTGLLVGLRAPDGAPTPDKPLTFDFAIMVGGFVSNDPSHAALYASKASYALPSVHILGRSDGIVPPSDSRALAARFDNPLVIEHGGGHVIASDPHTRAQVRAFLEKMLQRRAARAQRPATLEAPLWPGRAHPAMKIVFPRTASSTPVPAIVVFRGGGYVTNAGSGGGTAEWVASQPTLPMVGVEVEYRTQGTGDSYPAGYDDAARAVRLVRERAAEWGVDPNRIGVLGYSAGGHLASLLSTQPSVHIAPDDDLASTVSARPDFVILAYPVISFVDGYRSGAYAGSAESFFGRRDLGDAERRQFSSELHVEPGHPPVFIWTTKDDALVPYTHAERFVEACRKAHVPVTYTLFDHGAHGLGLALDEPSDVRTWTRRLFDWLTAITSP